MIEAIESFFLSTVGRELCVLLCSMIPVIELRGAIPLGFGFGLPLWQTVLLAVVGNMIPVPFILLLIRKILAWWQHSRIGFLRKFAEFLLRKVENNRAKIEKYSLLGVTLFVAIPLPATGAWTGSLIAAVMDMKFGKALLSAFLGVLIAAAIVTGVCLLVQGGVTWLSFLAPGA